MKTYTLNEVQDKLIGKIGTPERDLFEYELQMDLKDAALYGIEIFGEIINLRFYIISIFLNFTNCFGNLVHITC